MKGGKRSESLADPQPDPIPVAKQPESLLRREAQGGVPLWNRVDAKQIKAVNVLCICRWMARAVRRTQPTVW